MPYVGLDWSALQSIIMAWQEAGLSNSQIIEKLNDLVSGDVKGVINDVMLDEIERTPSNGADAAIKGQILNDIVYPWMLEATASGNLTIDHLTPEQYASYYENDLPIRDAGERSFFETTARNQSYFPTASDANFMSSDSSFVKLRPDGSIDLTNPANNWFNEGGFNKQNISSYEQYLNNRTEAARSAGNEAEFKARWEEQVRAVEGAKSAGRAIGNKLVELPVDYARQVTWDINGEIPVGEGVIRVGELPSSLVKGVLAGAGDAVLVGVALLDAYATRQSFAEALAKGDLAKADQIVGGLIGRQFGGMFLGAILGGAGGLEFGLPGVIIGLLVGAYYGTELGDGIGKSLFGELGELGLHMSSLVESLAELLRDLLSDPIVLDLDGDGLELTALGSSATTFDLDGDGIAERTGWVSPQDGFLVHDTNGNSRVDDVTELFGSANVDGFDDLSQIDGNGDGRIDVNDAEFSKLFIWRDLNSDGISTLNEMMSLTEAGIASLNLSYNENGSENEGNVVARTATYVRTDGTNRIMGSVQFALSDGDDIATIPANTDIGDLAALPNLPGLSALPDLRTAMFDDETLKTMVESLVYDDHSFQTFGDFERGGFLDVLYRWAGIDTSATLQDGAQPYYVQLLAKFLGRPFDDLNAHQKERIKEEVWPQFVQQLGVQFIFQASRNPSLVPFLNLELDISSLDYNSPTYLSDVSSLTDAAITQGASVVPAYGYLEKFSGLSLDVSNGSISGDFNEFAKEFVKNQPTFAILFSGGGGNSNNNGNNSAIFSAPTVKPGEISSLGAFPASDFGIHPWTLWYRNEGSLLFAIAAAMGIDADYVLNVTGWRWLQSGMSEHEGTAADDLLDFTETTLPDAVFTWNGAQTGVKTTHDQRLFGFDGDDELRGNDGVDALIGGTGNDLLKGGSGSDMYVYAAGDGLDRIIDESGSADTIYFSSELRPENLQVSLMPGASDILLNFGSSGEGIILSNQWSSPDAAIENVYFVGTDGLTSGDIASLYIASLVTSGGDYVIGSWADETINGLAGGDRLSGGGGNDTIIGGEGVDVLSGDKGDDRLEGGQGNDTLQGGEGDDVLAGGNGNDLLAGGTGNDTYLYNRGGGQDTIYDEDGSDTIIFGDAILPADVSFHQLPGGNDILIEIVGTDASLIVKNGIGGRYNAIEMIRFADGTALALPEILGLLTAPSANGDVVYGSLLPDTLQGAAGNDTLIARAGNDTLIGGAGNDLLIGGDGNDTYVFNLNDGHDIIQDDAGTWGGGSGGNDSLIFGSGISASQVIVTQIDGRDIVLSINGTGDRVTISGALTNGDAVIEQINFSDGTIWTASDLVAMSLGSASVGAINGTINDDFLAGGSEAQSLFGFDGNDVIDGGLGNDFLDGGKGDDIYRFSRGDGQDIVYDSWGGNDTIQFDETVLPTDVTVTQSNNGNDIVLSIADSSSTITLRNTWADDDWRIERVTFADGTSWDHAQLMQMSLSDNAGNNTFFGTKSGETLDGGTGNDVIYAGAGDDIIIGGLGDDYLDGGKGNDVYRFSRGDGRDVIFDNWGGNDSIEFDATISPSDVTVTQANSGNDLVLSIAGSTQSITLRNALSHTDWRIEAVIFAGGTIWSAADLFSRSIELNSGADDFYGTIGSDVLNGGAGSDTISAGDGDDVLIGGTGSDFLNGGKGNDIYRFSRGDGQDIVFDNWGGFDIIEFDATVLPGDLTVVQAIGGQDLVLSISGGADTITLRGFLGDNDWRIEQVKFSDGTLWSAGDLLAQSYGATSGADTIYGTDSSETLASGAGNDTIYARDGHDIVTGGTGNDYLDGGKGDDVYRFSRGDGQDVVFDNWGGTDTIAFDETILPSDITVTQANNGNDLVLAVQGGTDTVTLRNVMADNDWRIEQVSFANGTFWSFADLFERSFHANSGNDAFYGTSNSEILDGGAGNDSLMARDGNDILVGGTGNDYLDGGKGNDVYRFARGDGQDVVFDNWGGTDTIEFDATIAPGDITVAQANSGNDLVLFIAGGSDSVTLRNALADNDWKIEQVTFADGTVWSSDDLLGRSYGITSGADLIYGNDSAETISSGDGDDTIYARGGNDILIGGSGNDTLYGQDGSDVLTGGVGNDYLNGGKGNDIYRFFRGDGQDVFFDDWGGADTIEFDATIVPSDVTVAQANNGNDLVLAIAGGTDSITLRNVLADSDWRVEQITFTDGTTWTFAQIFEKSFEANAGNDIFYGTNSAETLEGGTGNDALYARDGADILIGGTGNDYLNGGKSNDIYRFSRGDGQDVVFDDWGGNDTVEFDETILPSDVSVTQSNGGKDLVLSIGGTTDTVTLRNTLADNDWRIEQVTFTDGTVWTHSQMVAQSAAQLASAMNTFGIGGGNEMSYYGPPQGNEFVLSAGSV